MRMRMRQDLRGRVAVATLATAILVGTPAVANAATDYPSDSAKPDPIALLTGYDDYWTPSGTSDLHGTVKDAATLARNDQLVVWINRNATKKQKFRALQNAEYDQDGTSYDQSVSIADGLGSVLGDLYVTGRQDGSLPLTTALINSQNGTSGAYLGTSTAKPRFNYPRPFLDVDPDGAPVPGDDAECAPSKVNGSSLTANRIGKPWANAQGDLKVVRVPDAVDTTHQFSSNDVELAADYGTSGLCTGGAFPSGHTTTAYQAGITLATLVPELAPEILARASEAGMNRNVLGVHYPLDIIGGRILGQASIAARWSDEAYRDEVLLPTRAELVSYLEESCGGTLTDCAEEGTPYRDNPFGGKAMPGGTAQIVTDRASAGRVYRERMTYGFDPTGETGLAPAVPAGAENLLLTTFPTLTDAQRTSVLAQTQIDSGYPLDQTAGGNGSWERLDLAAAMSAKVAVAKDGSVKVVSTGGSAEVVESATATLEAPQGTSVTAGKSLALDGDGLTPGTRYAVRLDDERTLAKVKPRRDGSFQKYVQIPRSVSPGAHEIDLVDTTTGESVLDAPLCITVNPPGHHGHR